MSGFSQVSVHAMISNLVWSITWCSSGILFFNERQLMLRIFTLSFDCFFFFFLFLVSSFSFSRFWGRCSSGGSLMQTTAGRV